MTKRGLFAILFVMTVMSFTIFNSCDIDIGLGAAVDTEVPTLKIENPPASKVIRDELNIKCRFYDLRGTYATKILNNGTEIRDVADILGHRNIETTENYYISSTETSRKNAVLSYDEITNSNVINSAVKFSF